MTLQADFCRTWSETLKADFLASRLKLSQPKNDARGGVCPVHFFLEDFVIKIKDSMATPPLLLPITCILSGSRVFPGTLLDTKSAF